MEDCAARLEGERILAAGADRFKRSEVLTVLEAAGIRWPIRWRGQGFSATADGSHDVNAFQRLVVNKRLQTTESRLLLSAFENCAITRDASGNAKLSKKKQRARIDAASAVVIAAGLFAIHAARPVRSTRLHRVG